MCKKPSSSHSIPMDATNRRLKKPSSKAPPNSLLLPSSHESRLVRSRSGAPTAMAAPPDQPRLITKQQVGPSSSSQRYSLRSKSTTKSRPSSVSSVDSSSELERDASSRGRNSRRRVKTAPPSPSAWSRSPGRGPLFNTQPSPRNSYSDHPITIKKAAPPAEVASTINNKASEEGNRSRGSSSSISKVFKYFRSQKKVTSSQAEELHSFRILHTTLLQWRFANARAESAMAALQHVTQERLVKGWIKNWELRESVAEMQIEMQQVVAMIKLHEILLPQIYLLREWPALETKFSVGLSRLIRKLTAFSCLLPILDAAQVDDVYTVKEALAEALQIMDNLTVNNPTFIQLFDKAEKMQHQLTEISEILKQEWECLEVVETILPDIIPLLEREECLRAMVIELGEARRQLIRDHLQLQIPLGDHHLYHLMDW